MQWRIPLFRPDFGPLEVEALACVMESAWLTQGERTEEFEREFARFIGTRFAVAVNSATAALHIAMLTSDVGPGDEVICPSLTFVATANAVRYCGATPVFADLTSEDDWNISPNSIESLITPRTKAIVVVHYAGYMCHMREIQRIAERHGLALVEDVAHAPGASVDGVCAGAFGRAGCFSFFSNKNMTTGEGGMLTTNDESVYLAARRLRSHGMTSATLDRWKGHSFSYDVTDLGLNYRMTELNAALGLVQLAALPGRNITRATLVAHYRDRLHKTGSGIVIPFSSPTGIPACHIMPILLPVQLDRAAVMSALRDRGIQSSIHYRPVHTFTSYRELAPSDGSLPLTERVGASEVTLPLYPSMTPQEVEEVCDAILEIVSRVSP